MAQYQNGYSSSEIMSMQKDAMRRVNEMQKIAQQKISSTTVRPPPEVSPLPHAAQETSPLKPLPASLPFQPQTQHSNGTNNPMPHVKTEIVSSTFAGILEKLNLDDEKILIILLIILLVNEGADLILILALGYILL